MATNTLPDKCPACGAGVRETAMRANDVVKFIFECGNVAIIAEDSAYWSKNCDDAYNAAKKLREALAYYATAMASDIAYDGGAKARVALMVK